MEATSTKGYLDMELLRFTTCGSVDDGKSTLIGRLLYDCKSIFQDQLEALERSSKLRGDEGIDLAHLTDGLRSEREQGITIDVAYRYFATPKRKFIIADTPGHIQYTRNMVTGASTADLGIVLIDARYGVQIQSKRHAFIASLLGLPHLVVAINKMDLVDFSQKVFDKIVLQFRDFSEKLGIHDITFIPISALKGDNVVEKSANMPWFEGHSILQHLETVHIASDNNLVDFRFPVQTVLRPNLNFRGYAGRLVSGIIRKGEEIVVLPSGRRSKVKSIVTYEGELDEAFASQSVVLTLADEIDISRGDLILRPGNLPMVDNRFEATVCWMSETPMKEGSRYIMRHMTRQVQAIIKKIDYKIDMEDLHRKSATQFELNEIGKIEIQTAASIFFDAYKDNRGTGSFVLIDPHTKNTVCAGMIRGLVQKINDGIVRAQSENVTWQAGEVSHGERQQRNRHKARVVWLTGLTGAGKTTIARAVEKALFAEGIQAYMLDGANLRHGLCGDLSFTEVDRHENVRRVGELARLFFDAGHVVLCPFISPFERDRAFVRSLFKEGDFLEIFVHCPLSVCKERDPSGIYARVEKGEISDFTGITSPYEEPQHPELVLRTDKESVQESIAKVLQLVKKNLGLGK